MERNVKEVSNKYQGNGFVFDKLGMSGLSGELIARCSTIPATENTRDANIVPVQLRINHGSFSVQSDTPTHPQVIVTQQEHRLTVSCNCGHAGPNLCEHQSQVLYAITRQDDLKIFFDEKLRHEKLKGIATDYGLEREPDPDQFFELTYQENHLVITPRFASLMGVTQESLDALGALLLPSKERVTQSKKITTETSSRCIILKQHKFYKHLQVELYDAPVTKEGKIKNPLTPVNPATLIWQTEDAERIKFFTAVSGFQSNINTPISPSDLNSLKAIVKNPLQLPVYYHNSEVSENIHAVSLVPVKLKLISSAISLTVKQAVPFYELSGTVAIGGLLYDVKDLMIALTFFIRVGNVLYLVKDVQTLHIIQFFKRKPGPILIHQSGYQYFKRQLLEKLEEHVPVSYAYIKQATPLQLAEQGFHAEKEKLIYLSDAGIHVLLIPVMKYGDVEIPIRTKKQIYAADKNGREFLVQRDSSAEVAFTALLTRQHSDFEEQLNNDLPEFYLHKSWFLNEEWFLNAFEEWQAQGITIFGFNEISGNNLNPDKGKITVQVTSGINWFNAAVEVRFGKKKASLKQVYKAIRNKSKFVTLGDGTKGILPAAWIEKLSAYFQMGDVTEDDVIRINKFNYASVTQWCEVDMLSADVQNEIALYQQRLSDIHSIPDVEVPDGLEATLRPYQRRGLNWLNLLDNFNFGGCLADDMGLGKTVQIIVFILSQRSKVAQNTNLLVVPTSLIFNWQAEVAKFAPSVKMLTVHGPDREKSKNGFDTYEIVLTSYGTLLADIRLLKDYVFNYIFLDESQNIKNPESQRYKAVCSLQSRNRIAITGTPVENNTFDLYGQLSFACPGLLGSKRYFRDTYSTPIDKFKVSKRATELQSLVKPFILRRTKQEVATELPEKTEVVLHCEMEPAQRKVYDAYEKEFREFISAITNEELPKSSMHVLKGLTRLRQICNSPLLLKDENFPEPASAKIAVLMDQIEAKSPNHKILVFSQFVSMLALIKQELEKRQMGFAWLTGTTKNRNAVVDTFQNNTDTRVFLISLKAGGTGLNLTAADYVYIVDPWWNPAVENQAIDRLYRIGQQKNVIAVRLICPDTVEEKIHQLQETKKGLADKLVGSDTSFLKSLTREDLLGWLD